MNQNTEYVQPENLSDVLTIKEVCQILRISKPTFYRITGREKNPLKVIYLADKSPRILKEDLKVFLDAAEEKVTD